MSSKVYILGGYQTDFSKNYSRLGKGIADLIKDTFKGGIESTAIDLHEIEAVHLGNFIGELVVKQGHLGGFIAQLFPEVGDIAAFRHEAACASGGIALMAAMADIQSNRYDLVAVMGVELEKSKSGGEVADYLGVAAWYEKECENVTYPWPKLFSDVGEEYDKRYGIKHEHLAAIAKSHYSNAKTNKNAQTRNWQFGEEAFTQSDSFNPIVAGMIRKQDCSQITDGGAIIFIANEEKAKQWANRHNQKLSDIPYIKGWGHVTGPIELARKLEQSREEAYIFPHLNNMLNKTLQRAGFQDVFELDCIETHDCFTTSAYMAIDHFGITSPGESWKAIEEGIIFREGKIPLNPSGGLIGLGHPVGATGIRMVLDAYKQIKGEAEGYQIEHCKNVGTLNIGGSVTTCVSTIIGTD